MGIVLSLSLKLLNIDAADFQFTPKVFFLFLLPPIMLESAFALHDRAVWDNIGTILLFAVIGTLINCFLMGISLYGLSVLGWYGSGCRITLIQCYLFAALISAVDPVAVLAIFNEVNVNAALYFLVFGESLLNDAVTVVLYNTLNTFVTMDKIYPIELVKAVIQFFEVSFGGIVFGVFFGILSSFTTKFTTNVRVVEPLIIYGCAYLAYLVSDLFDVSGIIGIIVCGLIQAHYSFANISHKSYTVVKYSVKLLSTMCDCVIFIFLGMAVLSHDLSFNAVFIVASNACCLFFRAFVVLLLSALANYFRLRKIDYEEQFIMLYGGLRGAVSFSLVFLIQREHVPHKELFLTATISVIFFTVFFQGITMKPLVKLLRIKGASSEKTTMGEAINRSLVDHVMAGIEEILGQLGDHKFKEWFFQFEARYIRTLLQNNPEPRDVQIMGLYEKIMMKEHYDHVHAAKGQAVVLDEENEAPLFPQIDQPTPMKQITENQEGSSGELEPAPQKESPRKLGKGWTEVRKHAAMFSSFKQPTKQAPEIKINVPINKRGNIDSRVKIKEEPDAIFKILDQEKNVHNFKGRLSGEQDADGVRHTLNELSRRKRRAMSVHMGSSKSLDSRNSSRRSSFEVTPGADQARGSVSSNNATPLYESPRSPKSSRSLKPKLQPIPSCSDLENELNENDFEDSPEASGKESIV